MSDPSAGEDVPRGDGNHVDVQRAEDIFHELERELSRQSDQDPSQTRTVSLADEQKDLEKSAFSDNDQRFNLREFLQSSNDAYQSAGIKHKHVGVTWDSLQVDVIGGMDFKVCFLCSLSTNTVTYWRM
jgi:ATP-binding cassette, subfamily G (WHITE), member 2, SNQ2